MLISFSLFTTDKMKDNEHVESPADGFSAVLSYLGSVESEKQEVPDLEQLKIKKPDEVCKIRCNVGLSQIFVFVSFLMK